MDKLKRKLSGEYWSGKRWMAYDILKGAGWVQGMRFFAEYAAAVAWCRDASGARRVFRIRVLAEVLAGMNGVWQRAFTEEEKETLRNLLERSPLTPFKTEVPLEVGLQRHKYCPAWFNTRIEPVKAVKTWIVMLRGVGGQGRVKATVVSAYSDFGPAMIRFMKAVGISPSAQEELLLVGQLEEKANWAAVEWRPEDGIVLFYRWRCGEDRGSEVEQINDPTHAICVRSPYFVSFDRVHGLILFFEGGLRRTDPGKETLALELDWFDFEEKPIFDQLGEYEAG